MLYCVKLRKKKQKTKSKNPMVTTQRKKISKYALCNSKQSQFIKEQETSGLFNYLGLVTTFKLNPLLGNIF